MSKYWITPPDLYERLDAEFHFDFDPCPYPRGRNTLIESWGKANYVNPPFCRKDAPDGGPSAFAHKAIAERDKGNTSVIILPVPNSIGILLEAGAEVRNAGVVRWLEADTGQPCPRGYRQGIFILRGMK